jgi:uncharacterized protein
MMPFSPKPQASSTTPCGPARSVRIALNGVELVPDLSGALYAPEFATLIVADIHLEKGSNMAVRGVMAPPYDTRASLTLLEATLAQTSPERLILLGDSFHDDHAGARIQPDDRARLRAITGLHQTIWITGNHDPNPPGDLGGSIADHIVMGGITLRHEPKALAAGETEISGHLHPGAAVSQRGKRIRRKCFVGDARRLIMPAFGSFTGALSVSAEPFRTLFEPGAYHVWILGSQDIYKFPARRVS